jgi:hypothetical protein
VVNENDIPNSLASDRIVVKQITMKDSITNIPKFAQLAIDPTFFLQWDKIHGLCFGGENEKEDLKIWSKS